MVPKQSTLIYLDTNVYSRPFDDQQQLEIQAEANAFLEIVAEVRNGNLLLPGSDILAFEVNNVLLEEKRTKLASYLALCDKHVESSDDLLQLGKRIQDNCRLRPRDALHVAAAIIGQARYFLSCDNQVVEMRQARCYRRLARTYRREYFSAMNPMRFVENMKRGELE